MATIAKGISALSGAVSVVNAVIAATTDSEEVTLLKQVLANTNYYQLQTQNRLDQLSNQIDLATAVDRFTIYEDMILRLAEVIDRYDRALLEGMLTRYGRKSMI